MVPRKVAVVTSASGAAWHDILNVSALRDPAVPIVLIPVTVQGETAAAQIAAGIRAANEQTDADVVIVARGGGSAEDLWCFNEEVVAQAIFDAKTPIISAVGHETDFSISDFVADLRAPTPSAAAEIAVFEYDEFVNTLERYKSTFRNQIDSKIENYKNKVEVYESKIEKHSPMARLTTYRQLISEYRDKLSYSFNDKLDEAKRSIPDYKDRLKKYFDDKLVRRKHTLQLFIEKLEGLSPLEKISRGFAYVSGADGPIVSTKDVDVGDDISLIIKDGKIDAKVSGKQDGEIYGKE